MNSRTDSITSLPLLSILASLLGLLRLPQLLFDWRSDVRDFSRLAGWYVPGTPLDPFLVT